MEEDNKNDLVIAIDGYSSCGKSTLAQQLADCLSYIYVDSGAMYRAVTLYFLNNDIDYTDIDQVKKALQHISIDIKKTDHNITDTILNGKVVSEEIRSMRVSSEVSEVAAISEIRSFLVKQQQAMRDKGGLVMDGRDIGTVVFPNADIKLFIHAELETRVERRYNELIEKGVEIEKNEVRKNLKHRDHIDSTRKDSPLIQAEDAILIDNTDLTIEGQLQKSLNIIKTNAPNISPNCCN